MNSFRATLVLAHGMSTELYRAIRPGLPIVLFAGYACVQETIDGALKVKSLRMQVPQSI